MGFFIMELLLCSRKEGKEGRDGARKGEEREGEKKKGRGEEGRKEGKKEERKDNRFASVNENTWGILPWFFSLACT